MMQQIPLFIYGAGGSGRETAWLAECCRQRGGAYTPAGYIDDCPRQRAGGTLNGLPVLTLDEAVCRYPGTGAVFTAAVGSPDLRAELTAKARLRGLRDCTLIHPDIALSPFNTMGRGVVICAGSIITTNIRIGDGVQINIQCSVSHDCVLEEYVTLAPGAHVCGNVHLERGVYIGAGAVVKNGSPGRPLVIGAGTVVGASACVTRSIGAGLTVAGVPARPLLRKAVVHDAA